MPGALTLVMFFNLPHLNPTTFGGQLGSIDGTEPSYRYQLLGWHPSIRAEYVSPGNSAHSTSRTRSEMEIGVRGAPVSST